MDGMNRDEIKTRIYSKIDELPTLPLVLPKLLRTLENRNSNVRTVADVISIDPALTSKLLKVANSAYYGFPSEITSLQRAVALLGFNMVRSLALSMSVIDSITGGGKLRSFSEEDLWVHSLVVATLMQEISQKTGNAEEEYEHLFIIGLLHDIGKIVFDLFFNDLFRKAINEGTENARKPLFIAERDLIGMDHGEVGGMLLKRWKFPPVISEPILYHHQDLIPEDIEGKTTSLLKLSDSIALKTESAEDPCLGEFLDRFSISEINEEDLRDVLNRLNDSKAKIFAFHRAMV